MISSQYAKADVFTPSISAPTFNSSKLDKRPSIKKLKSNEESIPPCFTPSLILNLSDLNFKSNHSKALFIIAVQKPPSAGVSYRLELL
jgi:hypothetical protein